jgi:hypothetical protein
MSGGPVRPPLTQVPPSDLAALAADLDAVGLPWADLHRAAPSAS